MKRTASKKLLGGRSAHIVVTMGMPAWDLSRILFQPRHSGVAEKYLQICRFLSRPHDNGSGWFTTRPRIRELDGSTIMRRKGRALY